MCLVQPTFARDRRLELTATEISLVGRSTLGPLLYLARMSDPEEWPAQLDESIRPFVAFTALDARRLSDEKLESFARTLLDPGCVYACAWGPEAGRVETAFDVVAVDAALEGRPYVDDVVMTTSHDDESLDSALWFALFAAFPPDLEARAILAITDDEWYDQIERRLADTDQLDADVLAEDEDGKA